jgi:dimethylargininase
MPLVALTREVSPAIADCELTHVERVPIDVDVARGQHASYERLLEALGCRVHRIAAGRSMPDSVFIEDVAVVLPELALLTRPGAPSRRLEIDGVRTALQQYRQRIASIEPPGTVDGGDVLVVDKKVFVGLSRRTNAAGIQQLRAVMEPFGYTVQPVEVHGCLHLKSAVTAVSATQLLANPEWLPQAAGKVFKAFEIIEVAQTEPYGANALRIGDTVVYPTAFPLTLDCLVSRGIDVRTVDAGELAKAEGAVTCCSLIFDE